jgi:serine protease inhibitor
MKKIIIVILFIFMQVSLSAASIPTDSDSASVVNGFNDFTFDLYHKVSQSDQNIIISPYSISSLLGILAVGSAENTRTQFVQIFHFDPNQNFNDVLNELDKINTSLKLSDSCNNWIHCKFKQWMKSIRWNVDSQDLNVANALWADEKFSYKQSFLDNLQQNMSIHFYRVDFVHDSEKMVNVINTWVEDHTNNYIQNLLPPGSIGPETNLILTNAIYFKGLWQNPFKPEYTKPGKFTLKNGNKIDVPMMSQADEFLYTDNDMLQMLQLPYKTTLVMAVLLPKPNHTLQEIQQALSTKKFMQLLQSGERRSVQVSLPKFKFWSTFDALKDNIQAMGLTDAFSPKANFSNITDGPLFISTIIQKAMIQVDEKGTIAAAATGMMFGAVMMNNAVFNANHPFLFIIFDGQSNLILFMGQVTHPET